VAGTEKSRGEGEEGGKVVPTAFHGTKKGKDAPCLGTGGRKGGLRIESLSQHTEEQPIREGRGAPSLAVSAGEKEEGFVKRGKRGVSSA